MKYLVLCALLLPGTLWAKDDIATNYSVEEYQDIIRNVVARQPKNKEVMYINMLYQIPASVRYDDHHLAKLERTLKKTSDRRFRKDFHEDTSLKGWMIELIQEFRSQNETKDQEIMNLAKFMNHTGHTMGDTMNNFGTYKLLFLIRYLSSQSHRVLISKGNKKRDVTTAQLLVVMQEEQNSRTNRMTM